MKARHFKKIRERAKWFLVRPSDGAFGCFESSEWLFVFKNRYHRVLAYSAENAVERLQQRGVGKGKPIRPGVCEDHAFWKVKEEGKEESKRTVCYF